MTRTLPILAALALCACSTIPPLSRTERITAFEPYAIRKVDPQWHDDLRECNKAALAYPLDWDVVGIAFDGIDGGEKQAANGVLAPLTIPAGALGAIASDATERTGLTVNEMKVVKAKCMNELTRLDHSGVGADPLQ